MKRWRLIGAVAPPVITFLLSMVAAEMGVRAFGVPAWLVPPPSDVLRAGVENAGALGWAMLTTAEAALIGFSAATIAGILAAIVLSASRLIERAFYPYTVFFQTVPVVAVAPLLVIWFGAGLQSVAISAFVVAVFPVIANTLAGLLSTEPALRDLFQLYGAGRMATLVKLKLPSALPNIVTGLRIAAGLAVIGTIVGEFVAGVLAGRIGLGILVLEAKRNGKTDLLFAAILMASLLGLAMFGLINAGGHLLLRRWHASERE
ncbi:MAG: ABC transporter permease [Tepidisphaerales bacterium]